MPSVLRRSGRDFVNKQGVMVSPKALISFCEGCNVEGAAFGQYHDGKLKSYCGWANGAPVCKVSPKAAAPLPPRPAPPMAAGTPDLFARGKQHDASCL